MKSRELRLQQGEDLRAIALRELDDPTRWVEIASLNELRLPFVINSYNPADRLPGTLIWGDTLRVPSSRPSATVPTETAVFGVDIKLSDGRMVADQDLGTVSGRDNLQQSLSHRIRTLRGELTYHPRYGCHVALALGLPNGPFASLMGAAWVQDALQEEARLSGIDGVYAETKGDQLGVYAKVTPADANSSTDLILVLNP